MVPANREWHEHNSTYLFAYGLGWVIVLFGVMIALHRWLPGVVDRMSQLGARGVMRELETAMSKESPAPASAAKAPPAA